ncbi:TPA: histidine kinase [Clostridium perfringens]|nr:histidine kinase [Clostridium perfringens]HBI6893273.1 histidine kinase [Clostridium perfringens]HBI6908159.1 histidine kinase [Clostridium perfringens]HBI6925980.1 histidine kinase [Clostridium perfringens]HBI6929021.1 histidine kinase [Clostridium perfringens]
MEERIFEYLEKHATKTRKSTAVKKIVKEFRLEKSVAIKLYEKWRRIWCSKSIPITVEDKKLSLEDEIIEYAQNRSQNKRSKYSKDEIVSIMKLRFENKFTFKEIARETGIDLKKVTVILNKANSYGFKI